MSNSPSAGTVVLIAFFTSLVTAVGTVMVMQRMQPVAPQEESVRVPDLAGLTQQDAQLNLQTRGLMLQISERRPSKVAKPGTVISQSLLAGTKVEKGAAVSVVLASESPAVPDVKGRTVAEATIMLEQAGFKIAVGEPVPHDTVAKGQIISQVPSATTTLEPGRTVTVVISDGPREAEVPKVVGMSINKAKEIIEKAGFTVGTTKWAYDEDWGSYAVIKQTPRQGEKAVVGSAIDLVVNED